MRLGAQLLVAVQLLLVVRSGLPLPAICLVPEPRELARGHVGHGLSWLPVVCLRLRAQDVIRLCSKGGCWLLIFGVRLWVLIFGVGL